MANINWSQRRNIENSLYEFLSDQSSGLTVYYKGEDKPIDIRVGWSPRDDWNLPVISLYHDDRTAPRGFVGQNKRLKTHLVIIDIWALDDGMRADLADWVTDTINEGFSVYDYTPNPSDKSNPNKTLTGKGSVEFVNDTRILAPDNVDTFEKFRHTISINITIAE